MVTHGWEVFIHFFKCIGNTFKTVSITEIEILQFYLISIPYNQENVKNFKRYQVLF